MRSRKEIYLDILSLGLVMIRGAAYQGDAAQCHAEADHLHNIPGLIPGWLREIDRKELHPYYWNAMKPGYMRVSKPAYSRVYEQLWRELEEATEVESQGSIGQ